MNSIFKTFDVLNPNKSNDDKLEQLLNKYSILSKFEDTIFFNFNVVKEKQL